MLALRLKAHLDKFWKHQSVKFDFTADLTGTGRVSLKDDGPNNAQRGSDPSAHRVSKR